MLQLDTVAGPDTLPAATLSRSCVIFKNPPVNPLVPELPEDPVVPLDPLDPAVPLDPLVPLVPLVPLDPLVPLVPLDPDVPEVVLIPLNKFVPTPPAHAVKSIYAPLAEPPCSKNLNLF